MDIPIRELVGMSMHRQGCLASFFLLPRCPLSFRCFILTA